MRESSSSEMAAVRQGLREWIDVRFYPGVDSNWDDAAFREQILQSLRPEHNVLDLGAGAGIVPQMNLRGLAHHVSGIDPNDRVLNNPFLDAAKVGQAEQLPYEPEAFDLVYSSNVLEHLSDPLAVFREVKRVLRPGGYFFVKTPNLRHYVPTLARCTPQRFHCYVNRLRGRSSDDTFLTHYLANSSAQLECLAREAGLNVVDLHVIEGRPEYLRRWWPLYLMGVAYERVVNKWESLAGWRAVLIGVFQKCRR